MIHQLSKNNILDVYDFILRVKDESKDFYITENRERIFINNIKIIEKLLKKQEIYGIMDGDLKALLIIYREKNFRPYIKILVNENKYAYNLFTYLDWIIGKNEFFIKVKKYNPICKVLQKKRWQFVGDRGQEILYVRKAREK